MKISNYIIAICIIILVSYNIKAQITDNPGESCACCMPPYTDFDFWKGKWEVTDTLGNKVGENTIEKIQSNCILQENWRGKKGGTGTSINYYNRRDSTWNQTWVSSTGNVLELKGKLADHAIILKSKLIQGKQGKYYNKITWMPNDDETVTQIWEIFAKDGTKQQTVFKGIYHRVE